MALLIPTYFSPISQYGVIYQSDTVEFEVEDNYQKQTYRNRCYIYGANGKQLLNIPIEHNKSSKKQKTKDLKIEPGSNWQKQHYKSLKSAYNSSPFFEFYEADLLTIFQKSYSFLLDVNLDTYHFIEDAIQYPKPYTKSKEYITEIEEDYRELASVKSHPNCILDSYTQVFDDKFGFIKNLSILDLLFMEGPNSISFLEKVNVTLR